MSTKLMKRADRAKRQVHLCGRVNVSGGTPSVAKGSGFTVADTAAGKVTISFTKPGRNLISAIATPIENTDATGYSAKIMGTPDGSSIVVGTYVADATDGALADNISFYFSVVLEF